MNQILFDTILTLVNLEILVLLLFLAYKIICYIRSKEKERHN